eukprot:scpid45091/ scgid31691/ 
MQSSTLAAAAAASHNSNGLSEQHGTCKLRTRQMLRTTIEQRHNQGRARGEMSRAQLRAEHQQETEYLCAMALQNDERASKKRAGGPVGLGAGDVRKIASSHEMGVGPMLGMPGNASASGLGAAGAGPHHHLHGPPQNRPAAPGVCDGLVCPHSTMDPSGLAGLSAPLCNAVSHPCSSPTSIIGLRLLLLLRVCVRVPSGVCFLFHRVCLRVHIMYVCVCGRLALFW